MKQILLTLSLLLTLAPAAPAAPEKAGSKEQAFTTVSKLISTARKENKLTFVFLGSETCSHCKSLKKSLASGAYKLPENFGWGEINVNAPNDAAEFDRLFKAPDNRLPVVVILDPKRKVLASATGGISKAKFQAMITEAEEKMKAKSAK